MNEHRNDWIDHPAMEKIDPLKRELIRTAAKQTQGKSGNSLAPVKMCIRDSLNGIANAKLRRVLFQLFCFQILDDFVHNV